MPSEFKKFQEKNKNLIEANKEVAIFGLKNLSETVF